MGPSPPEKLDLDPEAADHELLGAVVDFYKAAFEHEPEPKDWLNKNGLGHPDLGPAFKLGFANRTLGLALPSKHTTRGRRLRERLAQLGVFRADTGHEHHRGGIVVPFFDSQDRVVQLYGHLFGQGLRPSVVRDLWLPGQRTGLVNSSAFDTKEVVIAASVLDALMMWNLGIASVTAVPGLDGPFTDLVGLVEAKGITKITFAFPRSDEADAAVRTIRTGIAIQGVEFFRAGFAPNTNVFDIARSAADPAATITALVRAAEWIGGTTKKAITKVEPEVTDSVMESGHQERQKSEGPETDTKDELVFNFDDRRWRLEGRLRGRDEARLVRLHQNAQRLLRPVLVVNPFAADIVFPDRRVRARRDHGKLLGLVEAVALLHQHQRQLKRAEHDGAVVEFIEVEPGDIETATRLLEGLGLGDATELPPQTRKLLEGLLAVRSGAADRSAHRFTRRDVRERLGVGSTQAKLHLRRLVDAEYVIVHRSPHGRGVIYELAYDNDRSDLEGDRSGVGRPKVGGMSAGGRPPEMDANTREQKPIGSMWAEIAQNARRRSRHVCRTDGSSSMCRRISPRARSSSFDPSTTTTTTTATRNVPPFMPPSNAGASRLASVRSSTLMK